MAADALTAHNAQFSLGTLAQVCGKSLGSDREISETNDAHGFVGRVVRIDQGFLTLRDETGDEVEVRAWECLPV